tara:strand:- start:954 stop:1232 length:279 start_codon:yes stop_codon:yes gene_type:complete
MERDTIIKSELIKEINSANEKVGSLQRKANRLTELLTKLSEPAGLITVLEQLRDIDNQKKIANAKASGLELAWSIYVSSDPNRIVDIDDTAI